MNRLREEMFRYYSMQLAGVVFQACSIDHSDISPFRIDDLRAARNSLSQNPPSNRTVPRCDLHSAVCGHAETEAVVLAAELRRASYPTLTAPPPAPKFSFSINCRASCRRSCFWYCRGLTPVSALKCCRKVDGLMCAIRQIVPVQRLYEVLLEPGDGVPYLAGWGPGDDRCRSCGPCEPVSGRW